MNLGDATLSSNHKKYIFSVQEKMAYIYLFMHFLHSTNPNSKTSLTAPYIICTNRNPVLLDYISYWYTFFPSNWRANHNRLVHVIYSGLLLEFEENYASLI